MYRQNSRIPGTSGVNQQRRQAGSRTASSRSSTRREVETIQTRPARDTVVVATEAPMLMPRVVLDDEEDDDSETPPPVNTYYP